MSDPGKLECTLVCNFVVNGEVVGLGAFDVEGIVTGVERRKFGWRRRLNEFGFCREVKFVIVYDLVRIECQKVGWF